MRRASLLRLFIPVLDPFGNLTVELLVHFRAKKYDRRRDVDVELHHDDRGEVAVERVVAGEVIHVEGEAQRGAQPYYHRYNRPNRDGPERLIDVGEQIIDERQDYHEK